MTLDHDAIRELLAVHALDATDGSERDEIEAHLPSCDECRSEVDRHRQVASLIGARAVEPDLPAALWPRIESSIEPARVTPLPNRRMPLVAVTGIAAALLVLVAIQTVRLDTVQGDLVAARSTIAAIEEAVDVGDWVTVAELTAGIDGRTVALGGDGSASVSLLPDGRGFVTAADLPDLASGETYQLWVVQRGEVVSAGLLRPDVVGSVFRYDPSTLDALVVTREVAAGVVVAEGPAVAVWTDS